MRKRIWIQVGLVALALIAASSLNRPTLTKALAALTTVGNLVIEAVGRIAGHGFAERVSRFGLPVLAGLVVVVPLVMLTVRLVRRRRSRGTSHPAPWREIITLAQGGHPVSTIARQTRMSQDAIRIILAPMPVERVLEPGTSFRAEASEGGIPPGRRPERPR
ncbi:MAG: hypothetical protein ABI647_11580 [Gemmatimonadota bacterium]